MSRRFLAGLGLLTLGGSLAGTQAIREDAYRANNRGVALLEQYKAEEAVKAFREALALDPKIVLARVNLAIALLNASDLDGAEREAKTVLETTPDSLQAWYVRGLVARSQNRADDARAAFGEILARDPTDVGSRVNLGQLALLAKQYDEAIAQFRSASEAEPYNGSALYNLGIALVRSGKAEEGRRVLDRFQSLRNEGAATMLGQTYPEQGRYAEGVVSTGREPDLVDPVTPEVSFVDATNEWLGRSLNDTGGWRSAMLFDRQGAGSLDLVLCGQAGLRLLSFREGRFRDQTAASGLAGVTAARGALVADVDNDERSDLLVLTDGGPRLFRGGAARFTDRTQDSGLEAGGRPVAAAFADLDHDGDVDLVLLGGSGAALVFRNDGRGQFADVTAASLKPEAPKATAVVPTDFDNRRDMDLVFAGEGGVLLYRNMRDHSFRNVARDTGLGAVRGSVLAVADVNKDGYPDLFAGAAEASGFAISDGRSQFRVEPAPKATSQVAQAQFLDYDQDGLLDLVAGGRDGFRLLRNLGRAWSDVSAAAFPVAGAVARFAAGDIDRDGDQDLVAVGPTGVARLLRNQGGNRNHSLRVRTQGFVSNRSGIGAKVEMRAGSLHQKIETTSTFPPVAPADLLFGLGRRAEADAVRVIWPSGTMQAEAPKAKATAMKIVELDRKPSSCPYLYAWNGSRFEFITDFMGGGEMGYRFPNGEWNMPDPTEYVRLTEEQLRAKDGRYELRVTNELEELLFIDRLRLAAIDHPSSVEIHPNEGMVSKPPPFRMLAATNVRTPRSAVDEAGRDVADLIARIDDQSPSGFALDRLRGYASEHSLTLDLGGGAADLLLLTGWTDYAFSSDNVAAGQAGLALQPPSLQMRDRNGRWRTVVPEIGIPVGRPQTIAVALGGRWLSLDRHVRIVTNMRIYWDQIQVGASAANPDVGIAWLDPNVADLRDRGFSRERTKAAPARTTPDYSRVTARSPWKVFPGRYTRLGDVRELLRKSDDVFVLSRPGDELALAFDAMTLPAAKPGFRRTFLLFADGYSKEMDINSATPDSSMPLPFHGMTRYPYEPEEGFPMPLETRRLMDEYNTRVIRREIEPLLAADKANHP